jgi:DNA polymerase-3 subunit chi
VCELVRKAFDANLWTLVLARDAEQADALDEMLWDMGDDAYIPHQIAGDEEDELTPVLIATPEIDAAMRPLVINLRDGAVEGTFERVLEVVPADDSAREPLRERWKQYKARGLELKKFDM